MKTFKVILQDSVDFIQAENFERAKLYAVTKHGVLVRAVEPFDVSRLFGW